jgi:hypothetical protein
MARPSLRAGYKSSPVEAPSEFPTYARHMDGGERCELSLSRAWNHHHKTNPHHWEYWVPVSTHGLSSQTEPLPLPIPDWAIREMVADWLAVTWHKQGSLPHCLDDFHWYQKTKDNMKIHPASRIELETLLDATLRCLQRT